MLSWQGGRRRGLSVSLSHTQAPVGPPPSLLLLFAGLGFLVLQQYRAQLGRLGGSRLELGSLNKIPCHEHTFSLTHWRTDGHTGERTVERVLKSVFTVLLF